MKLIKIDSLTAVTSETDGHLMTTQEVICFLLEKVTQYKSPGDMWDAQKIRDKVKLGNGSVKLEDAEFDKLKAWIDSAPRRGFALVIVDEAMRRVETVEEKDADKRPA